MRRFLVTKQLLCVCSGDITSTDNSTYIMLVTDIVLQGMYCLYQVRHED